MVAHSSVALHAFHGYRTRANHLFANRVVREEVLVIVDFFTDNIQTTNPALSIKQITTSLPRDVKVHVPFPFARLPASRIKGEARQSIRHSRPTSAPYSGSIPIVRLLAVQLVDRTRRRVYVLAIA